MKYWENYAASSQDSSRYGRIGLPIQDGIDERITPESTFFDNGCRVANVGGVTDTNPSCTPIDKAEGCVVKAETDRVNEVEKLPWSGSDEDVNETCDAIDGV